MPEIFISHIIKTHPWIIILIIKHLTLGLYFEHHNTLIICLSHDNYTPPSYFYAMPYWLTIYLLGLFETPPKFSEPRSHLPSKLICAQCEQQCSQRHAAAPMLCCCHQAHKEGWLSNAEQYGCPSNLCWHKATLISSLLEQRSNQSSGNWGGWISATQSQADNSSYACSALVRN